MGKKIEKTNVMRVLEQHKVPYESLCYLESGAVSGVDVADSLGEDRNRVFKTLVTVAKSGTHYVFVIPCDRELELKKAAAAVGEKNIAMVKSKELLPLTGYIHGGCSPVGMKKLFPTVFHETWKNFDSIYFSAGKIGYQVQVNPADIEKFVPFKTADVCE